MNISRSRGFSLLEVMLALIVVAIGISVLLAFSASSHRETANKATGNDYGLVVNEILEKFVNDTATCEGRNACISKCNGDSGCISDCNVNTNNACDAIKPYPNETAYDYLCDNYPDHSKNTCHNNKISDTQRTNLQNAGINITTDDTDNSLTATQISLNSKPSDQ